MNETLYICGVPWKIKYFSGTEIIHEDAVAQCYKDSHIIKINPHLKGAVLLDTICHEIIHATFSSTNLDRIELCEENVAVFIGTGLASIFMDSRNKDTLKKLKKLCNK
jgi:hypothetical protein